MLDYMFFYENEYVLLWFGCFYFFCRLKGEKIFDKRLLLNKKKRVYGCVVILMC